MALSVVMPALEMAQETGKLLAWLKKEGDAIRKGEPLLEIETDKAVFELEAPGDGVLAGVVSNAGDVVPVGRTIAWIVAPGEQPPAETEARRSQRANGYRAASALAVQPSLHPRAAPASLPKREAWPRSAVSTFRQDSRNRAGRDHHQRRYSRRGGLAEGGASARRGPRGARSPAGPQHDCPPDGRAHHAKLDSDPALFPGARSRRGRADGGPQDVWTPSITITDLLIAITARAVAKHPKMNASWTGRTSCSTRSSTSASRWR